MPFYYKILTSLTFIVWQHSNPFVQLQLLGFIETFKSKTEIAFRSCMNPLVYELYVSSKQVLHNFVHEKSVFF